MDDFQALLAEAAAASTSNDIARALALVEPHAQTEAAPAALHFFLGSEYASLRRHEEARTQLLLAVTKAPDYHLARFQLGLMWLTAGYAQQALQTWQRLDALDHEHYFNLYRAAMNALIEDRFADCLTLLDRAAQANQELDALNIEMRRMVDPVKTALENQSNAVKPPVEKAADPASLTPDPEALHRVLISAYTSRKIH